jgi:hypothetical protein
VRGFDAVTTSNRPRLREPSAARALLDQYPLAEDVRAWIETDEDTGRQYLTICGDGWPRACRIVEGGDSSEAVYEDVEEKGAGFEQLLKELAPCLADPLTVQAVGHDECCFPFAAREWHIRPGSAGVEINDFQHSWDGEPTQEQFAVSAPGGTT